MEHILGVNPHFQNLSEEDAKFVIDTIPRFSDKMMSVGLLYEDEMNAVLGSRPGVDNSTPREEHRMSLNDRAIQYQRAAIISRPELLERLAMRKEDSTSSVKNKLNKKEEKARVARAALRKVQCPARNVEVLSDETHTTPRRHEMIAANSNLITDSSRKWKWPRVILSLQRQPRSTNVSCVTK